MKAHATARRVVDAAGIDGDEDLIMQVVCNAILIAAANGQLDLNQLAREELANRGLDHAGKWVGFQRAAQLAAA